MATKLRARAKQAPLSVEFKHLETLDTFLQNAIRSTNVGPAPAEAKRALKAIILMAQARYHERHANKRVVRKSYVSVSLADLTFSLARTVVSNMDALSTVTVHVTLPGPSRFDETAEEPGLDDRTFTGVLSKNHEDVLFVFDHLDELSVFQDMAIDANLGYLVDNRQTKFGYVVNKEPSPRDWD